MALAALAQAIVVKLYRLYDSNLGFRIYRAGADRREQVARRALGLDGRSSTSARSTEVPMRELAARAARVRRRRGGRAGQPRGTSSYVHTILTKGTSADRQLQVYRERAICGGRAARRARNAAGDDARRR